MWWEALWELVEQEFLGAMLDGVGWIFIVYVRRY